MKYLDNLKRTMGFITAAMTISMTMASCSGDIAETETIESNNISTVKETDEEIEEETEDTTESETESEKAEEETTISAEPLSNTEKKTATSDLFSNRDLNPDYSEITAEIALNVDSVEISGTGAEADGTVITITSEGVYHITGTLDDGQIIINADKAKVQLVLDNAEITCSYSAPIYAIDSDKVFITLAENSVNTLTDASVYTYEEDTIDEPNACIFSKDSLTINGTGTLNVNANYNDGIKSKDDVVITGGTINIVSVGDGIKGKDYVAIADGEINIESQSDGIKSTNATDETLGFVYIEGGTFNITAENDGIQAETDLIITDGDFNIVCGGGSENSTKVHTDDMMMGGGGFGGGRGGMMGGNQDWNNFDEDFDFSQFGDFDPSQFGNGNFGEFGGFGNQTEIVPMETASFTNLSVTQLANTTTDETSDSQKGLKALTINISGGNFNINSADDTLHSNGELFISGGTFTLEAGDDGIHADSLIEISNGSVNITKSYEGIEAGVINIKGGLVELVASDDGFNASDGSSNGAMGMSSSGVELNISGGIVYVDADGDGLDSNGEMTISGGTVIVNGPTNNGNGALDSNGGITVTGGLVIAAGSSGMAEYPDSATSTQNSVSATFDTSYSGDTLVTLLDSNGNEIVSFAPSKNFNNIVISSADIQTGETYTFYIGGSSSAESKYGLYVNGGYNNDGTESGSFTADSATSFVGTQSMMGGGGMMGGGFSGGGERGGFGGGRGRMNGGDMGEMTPPEGMEGMTPPDMNQTAQNDNIENADKT